jgi:hypothetical protein
MKKIAFTIVLNGMPFIKKQAEIIPQAFDEWHIIEGATLPTSDTAWCQNIDQRFYSDKKLSIDGTTEFLDSITDNKKIFVHRKNDFWNGKTEMCNVVNDKMEDCILMQFDVDEIWNPKTLQEITDYALNNDGFHGMLFRCNYFVGPNLKIISDDTYGNKADEWCRLWKIKDKTSWRTHEPPRIHGLTNFLSKNFTSQKGWNFDHYAYVLESQLEFKENFYRYNGALNQWKNLQMNNNFSAYLRNFLPWVTDDAVVNKI